MSDFHDFGERLAFSEGIALTDEVLTHIHDTIPGATRVEKALEVDDKNGTDYWVHRAHGLPSVSVDMKNRGFCPIERFGKDDACIETTSVYRGLPNGPWLDEHRHKPGWTIDERKRTDLIVYTWPHSPDLFTDASMRFWIVWFPHLCSAARQWWRAWAHEFGERPALNFGYLTLNTYPPRKTIRAAIDELTEGQVDEFGLVKKKPAR